MKQLEEKNTNLVEVLDGVKDVEITQLLFKNIIYTYVDAVSVK
jgi:hypothetical protein